MSLTTQDRILIETRITNAAPSVVLAYALWFFLGFVGLGISIYPYVVPRAVTIWDAAAPPQSQLFMLVGAAVIIPIILAYTGWAYWVFRGKVGTHGYH